MAINQPGESDDDTPKKDPPPDARFMGRDAHLATTPVSFVWSFIKRFQPVGVIWLIAAVVLGTGIETAQPYVFGTLVDAITQAVGSDIPVAAETAAQITFLFAVLAAIWVGGPLLDRLYWVVSAFVMPELRSRIQEYTFAYVLEHAPKYFLDTMAGSVAQKIRQAANCTVAILETSVLVVPRVLVMLTVSGFLLWNAAADLIFIFIAFAVVFLAVAWVLARKCQKFAKAHAKAQASLSGRLVDSVSNWSLVRTFARNVHERWSFSGYLGREWQTSHQLRLALALMRIGLHLVTAGFLVTLIWFSV